MNWKSNTQEIANKISRTLGVMNRLNRCLPLSAMKLMYDSLILSHFQFGITNWGFKWDRISKLQKRALRIMTNSRYNAHTEPLFKQLHLLKVKDIFEIQCLKFWYEYVNNKLPNYFRNMFIFNTDLYQRSVYITTSCTKSRLEITIDITYIQPALVALATFWGIIYRNY